MNRKLYISVLICNALLVGCAENDGDSNVNPRVVNSNPTITKSDIVGVWELDSCFQYDDEGYVEKWFRNYATFEENSYQLKLSEYSDSSCTVLVDETLYGKAVYLLGSEVKTVDGFKATIVNYNFEQDDGVFQDSGIISIQDECLYFQDNRLDSSKHLTTLRYDGCFKLVEI